MASRYGFVFAANLHLRIIEPCGNRNYTVRSLGVMPAFRLSLRDPAAQCLRVSCAREVSVLFVVFVGSLIFCFYIWVAKFLARFLMTPYKGLVHANFEFQLMPIVLFDLRIHVD